MMDLYEFQDVIPLTYSRVINGTNVTGLTVTVQVINARTNATLLASTSCPETVTGSGIYNYNWTHGIYVDTECEAIYTNGTLIRKELFMITAGGGGGRTA